MNKGWMQRCKEKKKNKPKIDKKKWTVGNYVKKKNERKKMAAKKLIKGENGKKRRYWERSQKKKKSKIKEKKWILKMNHVKNSLSEIKK